MAGEFLQIRLAALADVPAIADLLSACVAAMRAEGIDQWDEIYPTAAIIRNDVATETMYAAWLGPTALAGAVVLNDHQDPEYEEVPWTLHGERVGVVHRLMVDPRLQGRGLAGQLMRFIERRAAGIGYDVLRLDAFTLNPRALRLYERLGYYDAGAMRLRKGIFRGFEKRLVRPAPASP